MYPIVLFDVDGTLLDTREAMAAAYRHAVQALGLQEENYKIIYEYVGISTSSIFTVRHGLSGQEFDRARSLYYAHFFDEGMQQVKLYDGMLPLLDDLKAAGRTIAVATARSGEQVEQMLAQVGLDNYFDLVGSTPSGHAQGDKDWQLRSCMDALGAEPGQCVMVGDRKFDINGATKVGMDSIAVTFGFGTAEELAGECAPTYTAHTTMDIRKILLESD